MESFAKYYETPLRVDAYYVWTKNNEMAFNYLDKEKINNGDLTEIYEIVNAINGYVAGTFNASINPKLNNVIQIDGVDKLILRNWGG